MQPKSPDLNSFSSETASVAVTAMSCILQFRNHEDREPLIRFREVPPPEFMDVQSVYQRYDYVTAAQDLVRTGVREALCKINNLQDPC